MFLNIKYPDNPDVEYQANCYKFQDTIKNIMSNWDVEWYVYENSNNSITFQNNKCESLTFSVNDDLNYFSILFEFDKYKKSQINGLTIYLSVNDFEKSLYNNTKYLGAKIMELQILVYAKNLQIIKEKYKK